MRSHWSGIETLPGVLDPELPGGKKQEGISTMATTTARARSQYPAVIAADTLTGDKVVNLKNEDLGKIEHLMIDLASGRIAYAVLSFGGFLGMGDKLFAIPWSALTVDTAEKRFVLNADKQLLERAPGFDKNNWPDMADRTWGGTVYSYYGARPYWD
jgi:hypothetical protein